MEAEDFYRVISEFDFICDDIDEIKGRIDLTKSENNKLSQRFVRAFIQCGSDHADCRAGFE